MGFEITNQLYLDVSIGGTEVNFDAVTELIIVEEPGNVFPSFKLNLVLTDYTIISEKLNVGQEVQIQIGPNRDESFRYKFDPVKVEVSPGVRARHEYLVKITGLLAGADKYFNSRVVGSYDGLSTDVIKNMASVYVNTAATPVVATSSADSMKWISWGLSPRAFVDHLWMHGYKEGSLFVPAITVDGVFRYIDVIDRIHNGISSISLAEHGSESSSSDFTFTAPYVSDSSGFLNAWTAQGKSQAVWDLEQGVYTETDPQSVEGKTKVQSTHTRMQNRMPTAHYTASNQHKDYHKARLSNMKGLTQFSRVGGSVVIADRTTLGAVKRTISPLDKASLFFQDPNVSEIPSAKSDPFLSGEYILTRIVRGYSHSGYYERIHFCREGHRQI